MQEHHMKTDYRIRPIAVINSDRGEFSIKLNKEFIPALEHLEEFSHINVLWWAHHLDTDNARAETTVTKPYIDSPDTLGVFATRSPMRPNPIASTVCGVSDIDFTGGIIRLHYIDADNNTPVIDIKPYIPCSDRVTNPKTGSWCKKWPLSLEKSAEFDWTTVFCNAE